MCKTYLYSFWGNYSLHLMFCHFHLVIGAAGAGACLSVEDQWEVLVDCLYPMQQNISEVASTQHLKFTTEKKSINMCLWWELDHVKLSPPPQKKKSEGEMFSDSVVNYLHLKKIIKKIGVVVNSMIHFTSVFYNHFCNLYFTKRTDPP